MSITYDYKILETDAASGTMLIEYRAAGYETMQISAPLPTVDQDTEDVIDAYSPVAYWVASKTPRKNVAVGAEGRIAPKANRNNGFQDVPVQVITGGRP